MAERLDMKPKVGSSSPGGVLPIRRRHKTSQGLRIVYEWYTIRISEEYFGRLRGHHQWIRVARLPTFCRIAGQVVMQRCKWHDTSPAQVTERIVVTKTWPGPKPGRGRRTRVGELPRRMLGLNAFLANTTKNCLVNFRAGPKLPHK